MGINPLTFNKLFNGATNLLGEKYGENGYSIKSIKVDTPCSAEDNFLSEIYAIIAEVKLQSANGENNVTHNWIAKSQIVSADDDGDVRRYMFHIIFAKENLVYTQVLTKMEKLLQETKMYGKSLLPLSPKMHQYYTEGESYSCLFMDNLISESFYIPETHGKGIGLEECESVMKAVARFHALSLVMEGQDGKAFPEQHAICSTEFFLCEATANAMIPIVQGSYKGIVQLAEKFRPDLVPLLNKVDKEEPMFDRLCRLVKPGVSSFSCLCHGDPRLNNIFIHKDDIRNIRFIDFQLTRYASPLTDLQYLLKVGATKEFRKTYTDHVLQVYLDEFQSILRSFPSVKLLPAQEPALNWTFEKLKEEYEELTMYGFLISMSLLPIILLRPGDINKSVSQMTKPEREKFWSAGRQTMVFEMGCKHSDVRERLFDVCDEAFSIIKFST